jgi:hypothetical protein
MNLCSIFPFALVCDDDGEGGGKVSERAVARQTWVIHQVRRHLALRTKDRTDPTSLCCQLPWKERKKSTQKAPTETDISSRVGCWEFEISKSKLPAAIMHGNDYNYLPRIYTSFAFHRSPPSQKISSHVRRLIYAKPRTSHLQSVAFLKSCWLV